MSENPEPLIESEEFSPQILVQENGRSDQLIEVRPDEDKPDRDAPRTRQTPSVSVADEQFVELSFGKIDPTKPLTPRQLAQISRRDAQASQADSYRDEIRNLRREKERGRQDEALGQPSREAPTEITEEQIQQAYAAVEYVNDEAWKKAKSMELKFAKQEAKKEVLADLRRDGLLFGPEERQMFASLNGARAAESFAEQHVDDAKFYLDDHGIEDIDPTQLADTYEELFRAEAALHQEDTGETINITPELLEAFKASRHGQRYWANARKEIESQKSRSQAPARGVSQRGVPNGGGQQERARRSNGYVPSKTAGQFGGNPSDVPETRRNGKVAERPLSELILG